MDDELISVSQVANELGKQKQHIFKVLARLGIERKLLKSSAARGQKIAHITTEDYTRVREYFSGIDDEVPETIVDSDAGGVLYLIQLEPDHDPGRFKVGFATNIEERLRSHKTVAPFSKVLKHGPVNCCGRKLPLNALRKVVRGCTPRFSVPNR